MAHATAKHGDAWKLMHCDNLSTQVANVVKQIFWNGIFFIFLLPKESTDTTQHIDAAYGRSLRCTLKNILDM